MATAVATIAQLRRDQNLATTDGNVIYLPNNSGQVKIPPGGSYNIDTGYNINTLPAGNRIIMHPSAQVISKGGQSQISYYQPQDQGTSIFTRIWNTTKEYITLQNGIIVAKLIWEYLPAAMQILGLLVQPENLENIQNAGQQCYITQQAQQVEVKMPFQQDNDLQNYEYVIKPFEKYGKYIKKKRISKL